MAQLVNSICITGVAKTITDVLGIATPDKAGESIGIVVQAVEKAFFGKKADRILIYNPDAIGFWLFQKYTTMFTEAILHARLQLPLLSVMPSVTPVCFASMYTGAMPSVHGIQTYEKPILKTDTIFDALLRSELKPAIVSTAGDSMSEIFLDRNMDYFIYETPAECNNKAMELISQDKHDVIIVYNANYDSTMHRFAPESPQALKELKHNIETYVKLKKAVEKCWKSHRTMIGFCPDHGCHEIDGHLGSHGLDMADDMNVIHLYDFI